MSQWKKVKIGEICRIVKGTTGIAGAESGEYPLVVTAEERKTCSTYQFDWWIYNYCMEWIWKK